MNIYGTCNTGQSHDQRNNDAHISFGEIAFGREKYAKHVNYKEYDEEYDFARQYAVSERQCLTLEHERQRFDDQPEDVIPLI